MEFLSSNPHKVIWNLKPEEKTTTGQPVKQKYKKAVYEKAVSLHSLKGKKAKVEPVKKGKNKY